MRWEEGIQEFGFDCKVRKLSPKTIENYSKQLRYGQVQKLTGISKSTLARAKRQPQ